MIRQMFIPPSIRAMRAGIKHVTRRTVPRGRVRVEPGQWRCVIEGYAAVGGDILYQADFAHDAMVPGTGGQWVAARFMRRGMPRHVIQVVSVAREDIEAVTDAEAAREGVAVSGARAIWLGWPQALGMPIDEWDRLSPRERYLTAWDAMHPGIRDLVRVEFRALMAPNRYAGEPRWYDAPVTAEHAVMIQKRCREQAGEFGGCTWIHPHNRQLPRYLARYAKRYGIDPAVWRARGRQILESERYTPGAFQRLAASL